MSDTIKREFLELKLFQSDEKISQNYGLVDLSSVSDPLTFRMSKSVLTRDVLGT